MTTEQHTRTFEGSGAERVVGEVARIEPQVGQNVGQGRLTDLASRALGAGVVFANDDMFADRAHLILPGEVPHDHAAFGPYGKEYSGWETRRRREPGNDYAIIRLGASGVVRAVVIDTAWFKGNYPPQASVEAVSMEGHASIAALEAADWQTLLPISPIEGDTANTFTIDDPRSFTHVRLSIYPDGGVARFRVLGDVVADPRLLTGTIDLAALDLGGTVADSSNNFYSPASNLIQPGTPTITGEGWETSRRRHGGNDWVLFELLGAGRPRLLELDTTLFYGNAPGEAQLLGIDARTADLADPDAWHLVLPRTTVGPDARYRFRLRGTDPVTHVRLDVFPDGGASRVRLFGELDEPSAETVVLRWLNTLPHAHLQALAVAAGLPVSSVPVTPLSSIDDVPGPVRDLLT